MNLNFNKHSSLHLLKFCSFSDLYHVFHRFHSSAIILYSVVGQVHPRHLHVVRLLRCPVQNQLPAKNLTLILHPSWLLARERERGKWIVISRRSMCIWYLFAEMLICTVSVIFRVQVPVGFSPQECTDMKAQFRKPFDDVSLSLSASRTVVVPNGTNPTLSVLIPKCARASVSFSICLTWRRCQRDVEVSSPCVLNADLHLHMLQGHHRIRLSCAGLSGDLDGYLSCSLQWSVYKKSVNS